MDAEEKNVRVHWIDAVRGVTLISMIIFHAIWDSVYMYGFHIPWFWGNVVYIWQQSICWTFIVISGFSYRFNKRPFRRGVIISCAGIVITIVTSIFVPNDRVIFGVLTMIGFSYLMLRILEALFRKVPDWLGISLSMIIFFLLRNINIGYLGFEGIYIAPVPSFLYRDMVTTFLGFPMSGFESTDYFSVFPWFFLFMTGYFAERLYDRKGYQRAVSIKKEHLIHKVGKHTLLIYLIHQPVIVAVFELCMIFK